MEGAYFLSESKREQGPERMQTYRLISVLNQYYKLYTAILSKRIEEKLPFLIDKDQTGFTECRQTQDSLRRTFHTVEHIKKEKNKLTYPT